MSTKKPITPLDVLRNCRGKVVSVELLGGETINGTVVRVDRSMNILLKQCIRTGAEGDVFWKSRESLVRGASVRNVRMDERALTMPDSHLTDAKKKKKQVPRQQNSEKKSMSTGIKRKRES